MTFLSITPEAFEARPVEARLAIAGQGPRASVIAQFAAAMVVAAGLTVPGAVLQARWTKFNLIVTIVQHRCMAAMSV